MKYRSNFSLQELTTFKTPGIAEHYYSFDTEEELMSIVQKNDFERISNYYKDVLVLGKGSNILLLGDVKGVVLKNEMVGINIIEESKDEIFIEVGAGMIWHQLVLYALEKDWAGIENLALIPGTVGAAPVQNIGAYGVELKMFFILCVAGILKRKNGINLDGTNASLDTETVFLNNSGKIKPLSPG